jgi:hypothetical protein
MGVGKISFTILKPPPGFFIEPDTGEIQGTPRASSAGQKYVIVLV